MGDVVSLMLGPMVAACGGYVPMIASRGLGHTGGTLDKLEAIPGFNIFPDDNTFRKIIQDVGVAIVGQSRSLAPADQHLYAIAGSGTGDRQCGQWCWVQDHGATD